MSGCEENVVTGQAEQRDGQKRNRSENGTTTKGSANKKSKIENVDEESQCSSGFKAYRGKGKEKMDFGAELGSQPMYVDPTSSDSECCDESGDEETARAVASIAEGEKSPEVIVLSSDDMESEASPRESQSKKSCGKKTGTSRQTEVIELTNEQVDAMLDTPLQTPKKQPEKPFRKR